MQNEIIGSFTSITCGNQNTGTLIAVEVFSRTIQLIGAEGEKVKDIFSYSNLGQSFKILVCVMLSTPLRGSKRNFVALCSKHDSTKWQYRALLLTERNDGELSELCRVDLPETTPCEHCGEVVEWTESRVLISNSGMQYVHMWKAGEAAAEALKIPFVVDEQNGMNIHSGMYVHICITLLVAASH